MSETIDAQGLSCPQPVLMTMEALKKTTATEMIVLVDTEASKENVSRAVGNQGWHVIDITQEGQVYRLNIQKG